MTTEGTAADGASGGGRVGTAVAVTVALGIGSGKGSKVRSGMTEDRGDGEVLAAVPILVPPARSVGSGLARTPTTIPSVAAVAASGTSGAARRRRRLERAASLGPGARVNVPSGRRLKVTVTGRGWSERTKR